LKSRGLRKLNLAFLLLGLALLGVLLVQLDAQEVLLRFRQVGWLFGLAFGAYLATLVFSTLAWAEVIHPESSDARFPELFASFWAGHALNGLTPAGFGEVLRGTMVARLVDSEEIVASLVLYTYLTTVAVVAFVVVGPLLCLLLLDLPGPVVWSLFGITLAVCAGLVLVRAALLRGMTEPLAALVSKLPGVEIHDPRRFEERAADVDRRIRVFRRDRPGAFRRAIALVFVVRVFQLLELWILMLALLPDRPAGWIFLVALLTRSASQIVSWSMAFVPGRIGVLEGGTTLLFDLLRLDPVVGLSVELLRRLRKVLGIVMGLVVGWFAELTARRKERGEGSAAEGTGEESGIRR